MLRKYIRPSLFVVGVVLISIISILVFLIDPTNTLKLEKNKTKKIYFADNISPAHKIVIDKFNKKYADSIEVIPIDLPFSKFSTNERKELLARSLRSGTDNIDVFAVDLIWVPRFARWSEPLDKSFSKEEKEEILSYALESCYYDSSLCAIPMYLDIGLMFYRKDIIQKLSNSSEIEKKLKNSISWEEMISLRKKLNYFEKPFYIYQADDYEGLICNYLEILQGYKKKLFENGNLQLCSEESKKALQFLHDLIYRYHITPKIVTDFREISSFKYMIDSDAIFIRGWPGMKKEYQSIYGGSEKLDYLEIAAIPHFDKNHSNSLYGGWNLMISKFSSNKSESLTFIKYILTEEAQKILYENANYLPTNKKVYNDSLYLTVNSDLVYFHQLLTNGFHRPSLVEYTKISDLISHFIHRILKKEISINEALNQATKMIISKRYLMK